MKRTILFLFCTALISPLFAEVSQEESKKNRGAVCWLFDFFAENEVQSAKTPILIERYQGLTAKDLKDVDAYVQKRIDGTRATDPAKADEMAAIFAEMKAAKASAPVASAPPVTDEESKKNRGAVCWVFDFFAENTVNPEKTPVLIEKYQRLNSKDFMDVTAYVRNRIDQTRQTDPAKADEMDAIFAEMKAAKSAAAASPVVASQPAAPKPAVDEASKKSRGAICWLFDHYSQNPIKGDKTAQLIEHYGNLSEKDIKDVNAHVEKRIIETRQNDAAKADQMAGMYAKMRASRN